jgi:hypothetical protein
MQGYEKAGELSHALATIKWGTDYLLKCDLDGKAVVAQVGLGQQDHSFWRWVVCLCKCSIHIIAHVQLCTCLL